MSKAKKRDPSERVRKIGEREESIEHRLNAGELEDIKDRVMTHLDEIDKIESKKAEAVANYKAQTASFELQLEADRNLLKSRVLRSMIVIEEYLTHGNEVIRVRKDTGEQIGARTATPAELQEELFPDPPTDPGHLQRDAAPESTPPVTDDDLAFAGQADVFGEAT